MTASLRAITFNIRVETREKNVADNWAGERRNAVVNFILWTDPDILGLQEVLPKQLDFIVNALKPRFTYVGGGRDGDGSGESSPLFYKTDRFDVVRHQIAWLSPEPHVPGSKFPGAGCPRIVTCALLQQKDGTAELLAFNTHLDHKSQTGDYPIQRGQAQILVSLIDEFCKGSLAPRLIMGDFNSHRTKGAPPTLALTYKDCSGGDDSATYVDFDNSKAGAGPEFHIDWIFVRGLGFNHYTVYDCKYYNSKEEFRNASDHLPVGIYLHFDDAPNPISKLVISNVLVNMRIGEGPRAKRLKGEAAIPEDGAVTMGTRYQIVLRGGDYFNDTYGQSGWGLESCRTLPTDFRSDESTYVALHRPERNAMCAHFEFVKIDSFYKILARGGTNDAQSGWELCVERENYGDVRNDESTYLICQPPSASNYACNLFRLKKVGSYYKIILAGSENTGSDCGQLGWEVAAHRYFEKDRRSHDSTYAMLHKPSDSRTCNHFELKKASSF